LALVRCSTQDFLVSFYTCSKSRRPALGPHSPMAPDPFPSRYTTDQLNSTALKWGSDGELSELDLQRILGLLSQVDPVARALVGSDCSEMAS
jgi:hypothetical protein